MAGNCNGSDWRVVLTPSTEPARLGCVQVIWVLFKRMKSLAPWSSDMGQRALLKLHTSGPLKTQRGCVVRQR